MEAVKTFAAEIDRCHIKLECAVGGGLYLLSGLIIFKAKEIYFSSFFSYTFSTNRVFITKLLQDPENVKVAFRIAKSFEYGIWRIIP